VRKLKKISQEKAAADLKMSRPHLSNIEQGRSRTGWKGLRAMATYYEYGMRALIEEVKVADVPAHAAGAEGAPPVLDALQRLSTAALSEDEMFMLGLFRVLDARDRQFVVKQMLQAVQARAGKIGAS